MKTISRIVPILILLITHISCKKTTTTPTTSPTITEGYYIITYTNKFNTVYKDTVITFRNTGLNEPFTKQSDFGYSNYFGMSLKMNTNPNLTKGQYSIPSDNIDLQGSGQFHLNLKDEGSQVNFNYYANTGNLVIDDVSIQSLPIYYKGPLKDYYVVNGRWTGIWKDKTTNRTCNGEIILVNATLEK